MISRCTPTPCAWPKLLWFLLHRRFCQQNWYYVAQPDIFYNRAWRSQKGKILRMWASKQTLQVSVLNVHCLHTNEKLRDKMHIHLGCSTTHGRVKLIPHWIPQFHQIFTSSASSKMEMDKEFSCVFVRTLRRTACSQQKLTSDKNQRIKNSSLNQCGGEIQK